METDSASTPDRELLTPEQVAGRLETLDTAFQCSGEERIRRDAAWELAPPEFWRGFAALCVNPIRDSYRRREMSFEQAIRALDRISIGCLPQYRTTFLGITAKFLISEIVETRPTGSRVRRPAYPGWVRQGTADRILVIKERHPRLRVGPNAHDYTSPATKEALPFLKIMGWFGDRPVPTPSAIYKWVKKRKVEWRAE